MILAQNKLLRLATVFLFYFTQGVPIGLFFFAVPAWLGANGGSVDEVASVVAAASLPWTLKFVNGFLMDRYTYLAMGRRRAWIIGAQFLMVAILLLGAALQPGADQVQLLIALAFAANAAVTFQDVGIDGLAVDIMEEDERSFAAGIMFGAQMLGMSFSTWMNGRLMEDMGVAAGYMASGAVVAIVLFYGIIIREREGEKLLPWTAGDEHPRNRAIQVEAWWPLIRDSLKAMLAPLSIVLLVLLLMRAVPLGISESIFPVLGPELAGWEASQYTDIIAAAQFAAGLIALVLGGLAVRIIGAQRSAMILFALTAAYALTFALSPDRWSDGGFVSAYLWVEAIVSTLVAVATIPLAMRLCQPQVAATQFTLYMTTANFGRPLGAAIAGATVGAEVAGTTLPFYIVGTLFSIGVIIMLVVKFPTRAPQAEEAVEQGVIVEPGEPLPDPR
ncbi:MFS transporter [Sphingomicrobium sediminis]|uniref:MFS transporter n=1 Tax=Sphingomicrobium sediminis TaxID=2950949 RepID=A0A9X2J1W4_9SPHN|nr:MFS transporter [Sphingomicrobium sediminis]MCM8557678.1 MFS transporter [Sphingomicrobium sediminis]